MTWEYSNLFLSCVSETFKDYSSVTYHIMLWKNLSGYVTQPRNPQSTTSTYPTKRVNSTRKEQDGKQRNSIGDVWQVFRILYNLHTMRWNGATAVCGSILWVWWSPQKSNDWHKKPKSLTMALLYLFWFNITNNNITSPKRLAYKVDWLY